MTKTRAPSESRISARASGGYAGLQEVLDLVIACSLELLVIGKPGVGKTKVITQTLNARGFEVLYVPLPPLIPESMAGMPSIEGNEGDRRMAMARPDFLSPKTDKFAVVFDEVPQAAAGMLPSLRSLLSLRKLGDYQLPLDSPLIFLGNEPELDAGDKSIFEQPIGEFLDDRPFSDRVITYELIPDAAGLIDHARQATWHPAVIALLQAEPAILESVSPRSLERASQVMKHLGSRAESAWGLLMSTLSHTVPTPILERLLSLMVEAKENRSRPQLTLDGIMNADPVQLDRLDADSLDPLVRLATWHRLLAEVRTRLDETPVRRWAKDLLKNEALPGDLRFGLSLELKDIAMSLSRGRRAVEDEQQDEPA